MGLKEREADLGVFSINYVGDTSLLNEAYSKALQSDSSFFSQNFSSNTCAVAITSSDLEVSNGEVFWKFRANRELGSVGVDSSLCSQNDTLCNCSGVNCYVDFTGFEQRVYVRPYYVYSENQNCEFSYDQIYLDLYDSANNKVNYVTLDSGSEVSDLYQVKIPLSSQQLNSGCFRASLDIIKINDNQSGYCQANGSEGFGVSNIASESGTDLDKEDLLSFYSIDVNSIDESKGVYSVYCYTPLTSYSSSPKVGLGVSSGGFMVDELYCEENLNCVYEDVLDEVSGSSFKEISFDYYFENSGVYTLSCISKNE